jgi:hypothetical protein
LSDAERSRRWRERSKVLRAASTFGASTSTAEPAVPMDVDHMDSIDDVVPTSQESGFTKITTVTDDTSREPSAGADVSAASEAAVTTEPQYGRVADSYQRPLLAICKNK